MPFYVNRHDLVQYCKHASSPRHHFPGHLSTGVYKLSRRTRALLALVSAPIGTVVAPIGHLSKRSALTGSIGLEMESKAGLESAWGSVTFYSKALDLASPASKSKPGSGPHPGLLQTSPLHQWCRRVLWTAISMPQHHKFYHRVCSPLPSCHSITRHFKRHNSIPIIFRHPPSGKAIGTIGTSKEKWVTSHICQPTPLRVSGSHRQRRKSGEGGRRVRAMLTIVFTNISAGRMCPGFVSRGVIRCELGRT